MPELISEIMKEEHERLASMLAGVMLAISKKSKDSQKKFIEFKWNAEKHFFVEEKAIFEAYGDSIKVKSKEVHLIEEHNTMKEMMREFMKIISKDEFPDFSEFRDIILRHQKNEDDYFYTGLENNLNEDEKAEIINKTKEIILG